MRLESILTHGIVSYNYAKEHNITYSKNYNFSLNKEIIDKNNLGENTNNILKESNFNNIYLVRMLYVSDDPLSAYNLYVKKGISFLVENVPYISDKEKEFIKRSDEVVVKDYIAPDKIKAISIPDEYYNKSLSEINILPSNIFNFYYIKKTVENYIAYLAKYNHEINITDILYLLKDLKTSAQSVESSKPGTEDYKESLADYKEIIKEIDFILVNETVNCFAKIFGDNLTIGSLVEHINNMYGKKEIIKLEQEKNNSIRKK